MIFKLVLGNGYESICNGNKGIKIFNYPNCCKLMKKNVMMHGVESFGYLNISASGVATAFCLFLASKITARYLELPEPNRNWQNMVY